MRRPSMPRRPRPRPPRGRMRPQTQASPRRQEHDSKRKTGASTLDLSKFRNRNAGVYKAFCGRQVVDGVPFEIGGYVRLYGQTLASHGDAEPTTDKGIRIGRKFTDLYLIHNLNWVDVEGQVVAYVCLNYADGTEYIFPFVAASMPARTSICRPLSGKRWRIPTRPSAGGTHP